MVVPTVNRNFTIGFKDNEQENIHNSQFTIHDTFTINS
jgi:hypothetical protein